MTWQDECSSAACSYQRKKKIEHSWHSGGVNTGPAFCCRSRNHQTGTGRYLSYSHHLLPLSNLFLHISISSTTSCAIHLPMSPSIAVIQQLQVIKETRHLTRCGAHSPSLRDNNWDANLVYVIYNCDYMGHNRTISSLKAVPLAFSWTCLHIFMTILHKYYYFHSVKHDILEGYYELEHFDILATHPGNTRKQQTSVCW